MVGCVVLCCVALSCFFRHSVSAEIKEQSIQPDVVICSATISALRSPTG